MSNVIYIRLYTNVLTENIDSVITKTTGYNEWVSKKNMMYENINVFLINLKILLSIYYELAIKKHMCNNEQD